MNKKFSTLLCASLLLSSAFVANAADITTASNVSLRGANAYAMLGFDTTEPVGTFQLRSFGSAKINLASNSTDSLLAVVESNGVYKYRMVSVNDKNVDLQSTLWCVRITEFNDGQKPIFDFINKKTGAILAFDEAKNSNVGSAFGGWEFSPTWLSKDEDGAGLVSKQNLFTHTDTDKGLLLYRDEKTGYVMGQEMLRTDAETQIKNANNKYLKLTICNAGTYVLSAAEINAYLADNKNVLSFEPDAEGQENPFTSNELIAKGLSYTATNATESKDRNFVFLMNKQNEQYLKIDTADNGTGERFLKWGWTDVNDGTKPLTATGFTSIADQHKFLFIYKPSGDSLFIQVKQATYKDQYQPKDNWIDELKAQTNVKKYGNVYLGLPVDPAKDKTVLDSNPNVNAYELFVKLQDFTIAKSVVTVGERPINTQINFGGISCNAGTDRTSLDNGVYVIYNEKKQVLAAPIHLNDDSKNNEAQWVTLDAQDPKDMPAYQWVITKSLDAEGAAATSPLNIVNREFPNIKASNVQLKLDEEGNYVTVPFNVSGKKNNSTKNTQFDFTKASFDAVDSARVADKKLGYRYIPTDSLMVNKYVFNYLNPLNNGLWIANGAEEDSVIYVNDARDRYTLVEGTTMTYGIKVDDALLKKIPNLAQLERTYYVINMPGTEKNMVSTYDHKYSMGAANYGTVAVVDSFFFKENNHYNGKHYYAILEANVTVSNNKVTKSAIAPIDETNKAGVTDDGMSLAIKVQLLNETRTSAFSVEPDNTPLYRRFNNVALGESASDAIDSLVFVEKYRHEYLMDEMNPSFKDENIAFAGIWSEEKAEGKLAFVVDTAWVNRGQGYIKPQYLISTARADQDLTIVTHPCTESGPHITADGKPTDDPYQCVHATHSKLGFAYGKYLVSFADSVMANSNADNNFKKPYMDIDGGYTRVGFVKAIHAGDSLFILTNGFENMQPADLDTADIIKKYKELKINKKYIVDLTGDNHKNVTWSFRYVNPDKAAQAYVDGQEGENNEFLFESNIYTKNGKVKPVLPDTVQGQGKATLGYAQAVEGSIAPTAAAWLKMQNGCLVLTRADSEFDTMTTGSDGALIFNAYQKADDQDMVTDNEDIAVEEGVQVIAGNGAVTIQGAAGKTVVITNILGKAVANTTLTSDNQTINVPAGIVVVTVDGEAVKAIVK